MGKNEKEKMSKQDSSVTIREVYDLIDKKFDSVNKSVEKLTDSFNNLETGRLSAVEKEVASIKGQAMMVPMMVSIGLGLFFTIINYVLTNLHPK